VLTLIVSFALAAELVAIPIAVITVPPTPLGHASAATLGAEVTEVRVPLRAGGSLAGWYAPSTNGAAVVLLHGAGSNRTAGLPHARVLRRYGYGTLLLDARGHGESDGTAMDLGWWGDDDIAAAVDWLSTQPDVDTGRIALLGLSMGGEEAVGYLGRDDGRVAAVVAEGVTGRVAEDTSWYSEVFGLRGRLQQLLEQAQDGIVALLTSAPRPGALRDSVAGSSTPVLLVAAGEITDEQHAARSIAAGASDAVDIWVVPGAGHTEALATDPAEWRARVVAFLDAATS
jgi:pimeloyl-ACP methyl ester carboxylesterase